MRHGVFWDQWREPPEGRDAAAFHEPRLKPGRRPAACLARSPRRARIGTAGNSCVPEERKKKGNPRRETSALPFENQMEKSNQQPASSSCPTAGLGSATATEEEKMPPFLLKENHGRCAKHCFFLRYVLCTELPAQAQLSFPDHINQTQMPSLFPLAACGVSQPL